MKSVDIVRENGQTVERPVVMPLVGQTALILTVHERPVEGRVEVARGQRIELSAAYLPSGYERRWARGLFIEYAVDTGVYRSRTQLVDVARRDGAFLVTMSNDSRESLLLTRAFLRAPLALPIRVKRGGSWKRTLTVDIAGGGLRLPFEIGAEVGEHLQLELDNVPPYSVVVATGRVVRETPDGGFGVAFTEIGEDERAALMALAFAHRRAQRALPT